MQSCSRGAWFGFASTFFISVSLIHPLYTKGLRDVPDVLWWPKNHSVTWFNPGLGFFEKILKVPEVLDWRWSNLVTEWNATNVMLSLLIKHI
ncbi:hypothetical protein OUZ56_027435 [Daphnia magna]|uniref:Uncharacterized protein n=1 Tax=Daphnia magna TaxID=35525 RepID=A0ABQ9ZQF6_9CRUS|nr:hypothetical protein OUZ56_027435 [Daphnia magna]